MPKPAKVQHQAALQHRAKVRRERENKYETSSRTLASDRERPS